MVDEKLAVYAGVTEQLGWIKEEIEKEYDTCESMNHKKVFKFGWLSVNILKTNGVESKKPIIKRKLTS